MTTDTFSGWHTADPAPTRTDATTTGGGALNVAACAVLGVLTLLAVAVGLLPAGILAVVALLGVAVAVPARPRVIAAVLAAAAVTTSVLTVVWAG